MNFTQINMKKYIALSLCLLFIISSVNAKQKEIHSFYQHEILKIDADISDWGDMAIFDEMTSIISNISNDQDYIYIKIRISTYGAVSRLLMSGFTIWFNDEGKNRPQKGLAFPLKKDISKKFEDHMKLLKGLSKDQVAKLQKTYLADFNFEFASGFSAISIVDNDFNDIYYRPSNLNDEGLSAIVKLIDYDLFIYEARIPIDLVLNNKKELLNSDQESFSIGFEYGKIKIEIGDQTTNMPVRERTSSYNRRNRHQVQDYSEIPALTTWYKKVYLSKE